jgi:two-component system OmpR family sensor kinase
VKLKLVPKSIRWRLQLWYGLILLVVLAGFGFTADRLERSRQLRQIDRELHQRISTLATALRPPPREPGQHGPRGLGAGAPGIGPAPRPPRGGEPDREREGPRERGPRERPGGREGSLARAPEDILLPAPPDGGPDFGPRRPAMLRWEIRDPREVRLRPEDAALFDRDEVSPFYYVIWGRDGRVLTHSPSAPLPITRPDRRDPDAFSMARSRGDYREAFVFGGPGDCILVGRSMAQDRMEMARRTLWLSATGVGVLLLGLAGGWWLASRAIRPVEVISETAARISGGDLSQRISLAETESELGRLAGVLNSTFARLEAAFAQQSQFTSDAAHELRTPVTVLLTQTQMALARDRSTAEYRETLEACQRAAQRMRRLIESLLALVRLDGGQESLQRTHLNLADVVRDAVDLVQPLAAQRSITLHSELPELPWRCGTIESGHHQPPDQCDSV